MLHYRYTGIDFHFLIEDLLNFGKLFKLWCIQEHIFHIIKTRSLENKFRYMMIITKESYNIMIITTIIMVTINGDNINNDYSGDDNFSKNYNDEGNNDVISTQNHNPIINIIP